MQPSLIDDRPVILRPGAEPVAGFRLVRRRGRGGFGEVWEVAGPGGFPAALKFVPIAAQGRSSELRSLDFLREIRHPNLLTGFGSWLVDGTLVIGMELADGSLWDRYLAATREGYRGIPRGELLGYLGDVAAGIDYLNGYRHSIDGRPSVGIQHRDLKPPNILLFGGGAKVADLGMARVMEGEVADHTGSWTVPYAAPEFFRGETTRQSDQYSLAATYCQLRGGRLPFSGSAATITAGHLLGRPDLDALPEPERAIVGRALAKEPGDRWPDCRAFVAALRSVPAAAAADILLDPDDPPPSLDDLSSWEVHSPTDGAEPAPADARLADSRWLLETTGAGPGGSSESVPTRILAQAAPARPRDDPPPARRRQRAAAASVGVLLLASLAAREAGPGPARPPVPAPVPVPIRSGIARMLPPVVAPQAAEIPVEVAAPPVDSSRPGPFSPGPPPATPSGPATAPPPDALAPAVAATAEESGPPPEGPIAAEAIAAAASSSEAVAAAVPSSEAVAAAALSAVSPDGAIRVVVAAPEPTSATAARVAVYTVPAQDRPAESPAPEASALPPALPDRSAAAAAREAFARGREAFARRAFARAIPEFSESLRLDPGHAASHFLRGAARHRSGDPRAALVDYDATLRLRPGDANATISRGQAYHDLGDYDRADAEYTEALRLRPVDGDVHFRRGLSRFKAGDYAGAIGDFDATLRIDGNHLYAGEFRVEALARRDTKAAPPVAPTPASAPAAAVHATADVNPTPQPVRATTLIVPAPATTVPARSAPRPAEKRPGVLRRLVAGPFARGR